MLTEHGTPIAPSTFYDARNRTSTRVEREEQLKAEVVRAHEANYGAARSGWHSTARAFRSPGAPWSG